MKTIMVCVVIVVLAFTQVYANSVHHVKAKRETKCQQNETVIQSCGECTGYPRDCGFPSRMIPDFRCPPPPCDHPTPVCVCKDGYVRENDTCILKSDCPAQCPENEHQTMGNCHDYMEANCQESCTRGPSEISQDHSCRVVCDAIYCACDSGYVRDDETLKCIKKEICPQRRAPIVHGILANMTAQNATV